jgi:hypothetical protein
MAVEPLCNGPCRVELAYDGGFEQQGARWLSAAAFLAGLVSMVVFRKRVRA